MDILNQWEAEATELQNIWERNLNPTQAACCERILSLIAAIREQSKALNELVSTPNMACTEDYQEYLYRMQRAKVHMAEAERILKG